MPSWIAVLRVASFVLDVTVLALRSESVVKHSKSYYGKFTNYVSRVKRSGQKGSANRILRERLNAPFTKQDQSILFGRAQRTLGLLSSRQRARHQVRSRTKRPVGMTSKANKAWKQEHIEKAQKDGLLFLMKDEFDDLKSQLEIVKKNPHLQFHLDKCMQTNRMVELDFMGYQVKGELDAVGSIIFDLKRNSSATTIGQQRRIFFNMHYYFPASFYHYAIQQLDGRDLPVIYGNVDTNNNYLPFEVSKDVLQYGIEQWEFYTNELTKAIKNGDWDAGEEYFHMGSNAHAITLDLPAWLKK